MNLASTPCVEKGTEAPETEPPVCAADVRECPDGTSVQRDPQGACEFPDCPSNPTPCTGCFCSKLCQRKLEWSDCRDASPYDCDNKCVTKTLGKITQKIERIITRKKLDILKLIQALVKLIECSKEAWWSIKEVEADSSRGARTLQAQPEKMYDYFITMQPPETEVAPQDWQGVVSESLKKFEEYPLAFPKEEFELQASYNCEKEPWNCRAAPEFDENPVGDDTGTAGGEAGGDDGSSAPAVAIIVGVAGLMGIGGLVALYVHKRRGRVSQGTDVRATLTDLELDSAELAKGGNSPTSKQQDFQQMKDDSGAGRPAGAQPKVSKVVESGKI